MLKGKICPKCAYERTGEEDPTLPILNCPNCGIAYSKYIKTLSDDERIDLIKAKVRTGYDSQDEYIETKEETEVKPKPKNSRDFINIKWYKKFADFFINIGLFSLYMSALLIILIIFSKIFDKDVPMAPSFVLSIGFANAAFDLFVGMTLKLLLGIYINTKPNH